MKGMGEASLEKTAKIEKDAAKLESGNNANK